MPEVPSGTKTSLSPPLDAPLTTCGAGDESPAGDDPSEVNGEAAHTIPGECERLFCDTLAATFLGGRRVARQESLGMGAFPRSNTNAQAQAACAAQRIDRIQLWLEVWDYNSDAIYRGFVTGAGDERSLFVFFGEGVEGHGLKSGYDCFVSTELSVVLTLVGSLRYSSWRACRRLGAPRSWSVSLALGMLMASTS